MSQDAEKVLEEISRLPNEDRMAILEHLIEGIDQPFDHDVEMAWQQEIEKRIDEVERGDVKLVPWELVREKARRKFGA